jgi:subtilisin
MSANPDADRGSETGSHEGIRASGETEAVRGNRRGGPGKGSAKGPAKGPALQSGQYTQYTVTPTSPGATEAALVERLGRFGNIEILRTVASRAAIGPPVAVVRMTAGQEAGLRQSAGDLLIERDAPLQLASSAASVPFAGACAIAYALGGGFAATIQALNESDQPLADAEVQIVGQHWTAQGITGSDGKVALTLHGELPTTVTELLIKPRADAWGVWQRFPVLQENAVNTVNLRALPETKAFGWGATAMGFDRLPAGYGGAGVKIALIDSGVANSHAQLGAIDQGIDAARGDEPGWSMDQVGHGTLCAGILAAKPGGANDLRGYAPDAELHVCKLPLDAACSDFVAALDACLQAGVDLMCLGYSCQQPSAIVEQRIAAAKRRGIAVVAPAGNSGGPVQFPACSPHVLAVGAVGRSGTFPDDSPHAAHEAAGQPIGGQWFAPAFSCRGDELDLGAPGVAVITCQSPSGYIACDGTSVAAAHVTALAALVLAHHPDFQGRFASRDAMRVERLFQILKQTAQPLADPLRVGAGLPNAPGALGLELRPQPFVAPLHDRLGEMRSAVRQAGFSIAAQRQMPQPPRGPAATTHFPLNIVPPAAMTAAGASARLSELKTAMQLAGLSPGH